MLIIFAAALVLVRLFYSLAECYFEHDWPRRTWKGLLLALVLLALCSSAFGQSTRIDQPLLTNGPNVSVSGGALPQTLWAANSTVAVCTHPSTTYAYCLAHPTATFTDSTGGTQCSSTLQLVQLPGTTCTASAGVAANVGFWYGGGLVDYWVVSSYGTFGPFTVGGPGSGGTTTQPLTPATSGGVSPGSPFNGSAAVTIDAQSLGALSTVRTSPQTIASPLTIPVINNVCQVPAQAGADFAAQVNACISALGAGGGTIDATGSVGAQTASSANISIPSGTVLKLGGGTVITGTSKITMSLGSSIQGPADASTGYNEAIAAQVVWQFTGTGNFITVPDNQWDVSLSGVTFKGPLYAAGNTGGGTGHGLYVQGYAVSSNFGVTGLVLDHVSFIGFWQDGIHLEDNVYLVHCVRCVALQNGGNGWYQAPVNSTQAPNQVTLDNAYLESNGINSGSDLYAQGGLGAGEIHVTGGTISSDLAPAAGTELYCAQFVAAGSTGISAWIKDVHLEGCGKSSSGGGAFIDWNVVSGYLHYEDNSFSNPLSGYNAYPVQFDTNFANTSQVFAGPSNVYSTPYQTYRANLVSSSSTGYVTFYDPIGAPQVNGLPSSAALNGFGYPYMQCGQIYGQAACSLQSTVEFYFPDSRGGGQNFQLYSQSGALNFTDSQGNPILSLGPTSLNGNRSVWSQAVQFNANIWLTGGTAGYGTAGQVFTSAGPGAAAYWGAGGGGGGSTPNMVVTTTSYTVPQTGLWVRANCPTACTVTLPSSITTGFNALIEMATTSAAVTIAPNGVTYDGVTTQLLPGESTYVSTDGLAYHSTVPFSSLPLYANFVTAASPAYASNLMCVSAGANKACAWQDYPEPLIIPAANASGSTAGTGWTLPASGAATAAVRTGSNVNAGVLQFSPSNSAQFQVKVPADYDSAGAVYASLTLTQAANTTSGQTIIMQIQTACPSTTDDPAFNTAQAFSTVTTGSTAHTIYVPTLSFVTMTGCSAGQMMNVKISRSGSDTATTAPNVYQVVLTIPRAVKNQAN